MQSLKQEIAFMPGSIFGAKDGYIRLSYGKVNINQIEEGISRLRRLFWFVGNKITFNTFKTSLFINSR